MDHNIESNEKDGLLMWLSLFKAETEEDLAKIQEMGGPVIKQAIEAYREVCASEKFREIERMRDKARVDEAYALRHAHKQGVKESDEKWQGIVAEQASIISEKDALIAELKARLGEN